MVHAQTNEDGTRVRDILETTKEKETLLSTTL